MDDSTLTVNFIQTPHVTVVPPGPPNEVAWAGTILPNGVRVEFRDGTKATFSGAWLRKIADGA